MNKERRLIEKTIPAREMPGYGTEIVEIINGTRQGRCRATELRHLDPVRKSGEKPAEQAIIAISRTPMITDVPGGRELLIFGQEMQHCMDSG